MKAATRGCGLMMPRVKISAKGLATSRAESRPPALSQR